jgi:hypothetical protein
MFQKVFLKLTEARRFRSRMIALCAIGAIVLVAMGPSPLLANPGTVTMRVDPARRAAPVNGTFTVNIVADAGAEMNPNGLGAYEFDLVYNKNYLEVNSVSDTGELSSTNRTVSALGPNIDNPGGRTTFGAYSYPPQDVAGPSNTVVLATVTLTGTHAGVTTLNLENALLTDTQANAWPDGGTRVLTTQGGTIKVNMPMGQYDSDGKTDIGIWRNSDGWWLIMQSSKNYNPSQLIGKKWGYPTSYFTAMPGDYDGDGKIDLGLWNYLGWWLILQSSKNYDYGQVIAKKWGDPTNYQAVPGDYDGDGKLDLGMWSSTGWWLILLSSKNYDYGQVLSKQWGTPATSQAVPGDYDGDGKTDMGIWRNDGWWLVLQSSKNYDPGQLIGKKWGYPTSYFTAMPADYDGDGKTDLGLWNSIGWWLILQSSKNYDYGQVIAKKWGDPTNYQAVCADYDGDGKTDLGMWSNAGWWLILLSSKNYDYGQVLSKQWGTPATAVQVSSH